jgi:integrase
VRFFFAKNRTETQKSWKRTAIKTATKIGPFQPVLWALKPAHICSWLAMAGASIKDIQEAAGHKSIIMSARYSHLSPAHKLSVVERIASASK